MYDLVTHCANESLIKSSSKPFMKGQSSQKRKHLHKNVFKKNNRGKYIIKKLFEMITKNPKKFISRKEFSIDKFRAISDFISGMTDRYAINLYKDLK